MSFLPPKLLNINIVQINPIEFWTSDDGTGDPWLGYPYKWEATFTVAAQFHSSHLTREPFVYHGMDVKVGDWITDFLTAFAVKIVSIDAAQTNSETVVCVVEDVDRYNTFTDPTGSGTGVCSGGPGILFELSDDGMPVFGNFSPFYAALSNNLAFQNDLEARFRHRNIIADFIQVNQSGHALNIGDAIQMDENGLYVKSIADAKVNKTVGTVTEVSSNGSTFSYRPIGRYIESLEVELPGVPGDLIYVGGDGAFTNVKPESFAMPIYIRLDAPNKAIFIDRGIDGGSGGGTPTTDSFTRLYSVPSVTTGQTIFTMPVGALEVTVMTINGMENTNYTFDSVTRELIFDPVETGYGVDEGDDVMFMYRTNY
jgi:hypothetical protein